MFMSELNGLGDKTLEKNQQGKKRGEEGGKATN